ncbi:MAG TPA: glucose 1-dehydrogenase [Terriglobales bacterium]|nr:glucose 1-dehydrogenase [Terriglobales bacterium]
MQLRDKVAIITGAGAGIGRACCLLFAAEGAKIVAVDLDPAALDLVVEDVRSNGGSILAIQADVSRAEDVERVVSATSEKFATINILFNNAGIVPHGKIHETTEDDWDRTMAVNVKSMYLMSHAVVPIFLKHGGGVILNTSSATALRSVVDRAAYSASKGAVLALTKSMAIDYVRDGVRVNCLCPGTIDTPSLNRRLAAFADPEEARKQFVARQPMGRLGTAEEVAKAALFLVSEDAKFVTGAAFSIDGGFTV